MHPTHQVQAHAEAACKITRSTRTDSTDRVDIAQHWTAEATVKEMQDNHVESLDTLEIPLNPRTFSRPNLWQEKGTNLENDDLINSLLFSYIAIYLCKKMAQSYCP